MLRVCITYTLANRSFFTARAMEIFVAIRQIMNWQNDSRRKAKETRKISCKLHTSISQDQTDILHINIWHSDAILTVNFRSLSIVCVWWCVDEGGRKGRQGRMKIEKKIIKKVGPSEFTHTYTYILLRLTWIVSLTIFHHSTRMAWVCAYR